MTTPMTPQPRRQPAGSPPRGSRETRDVDAVRLWSGGVATAVVAGLIALVGVFVCRYFFNIWLLSPQKDGAYGNVHTTALVLVAAAAALVATGLVWLLLISTPRPLTFFGWIIALITVLIVVLPFSTQAPVENKVATAVVDLLIGFAVGSLVSSVAARAVRRPAGAVGYNIPTESADEF